MNIPKLLRLALPAVLLLFVCLSLSAQTSEIYIVDTETEPGEEVELEVRAVRLANVVGLQVNFQWDPEVLKFVAVSDVVKSGNLDKNFNRTLLSDGRIGYFFYDESLRGLGSADSSLLFKLRFLPLAGAGVVANVSFTDSPLRTVVSNADNDSIPTIFIPGQIDIGMISGFDPVYTDDKRFTASPNPFSTYCTVDFALGYGGKANFAVIDVAGRKVTERAVLMTATNNKIILNAADLPVTGPYILRLTTDREQLYRRVIVGRPGQ